MPGVQYIVKPGQRVFKEWNLVRKKEQESSRGRSDTDRSKKMAVSETDQSQFSLEAEDLQSDQEKRTSVVVRNKDI